MSSPPPNPDTRPLPPGWIQQYNWEYNAWFYVNQREQPPRSSWEHPASLSQYAPPPGAPPPPNRDYNRSPYGGGYNQPSNAYAPSYAQGGYGGGGNAPPGGYQSYPPAGESRGLFGFGGSRPQQQQQPVYAQAPPKKGMGMGTVALAAGGGLLGGMLLEDMIDNHDEHEREEGYDQGYDQGYDNGFDNGDDGGGDFF